ncbi:hemolymph lipopolysaccharide-binding protein isoform X2 [Anabrus simplex]|uniref:hemolymph lipopolysaccharide-binding protein isoform X2 n=1 Tax=Anabrus simplex TaxID=316456 RepID=UPI0035A3A206
MKYNWANSSTLMPNRNIKEGEQGEDVSMDVELVVTTGDDMEVVQLYSTTTVQIPYYPPADYIQFPEVGFYKVHGHPLTWFEARLKCIAEGADLMVLDSMRSVEIFKALLSQFRDDIQRATGYEVAYVGVYDFHKNNTFLTVQGNPVNGSLWYSGQPSGDDNFCCYADNDAALVNYKCSVRLSFICERRLE